MKCRLLGSILVCIAAAGAWAAGAPEEPGPGLYAEMQTSKGTMIFELDYRNTPLTAANFAGLAKGILKNSAKEAGTPFFDGMPIYRAIKGYAVFIGDPVGTGSGGPGYSLPRESTGKLSAAEEGVLVMDGLVTESAGSRFFITIHGDASLDSKYTSFGQIVSGKAVLKKLKIGDIIESIKILQIGAEAEALSIDQNIFDNLLAAGRMTEVNNLKVIDPALADIVHSLGEERRKSRTGIYYSILTEGKGAPPASGNRVSMHYTGTLIDGTVFDSSKSRGQTFDFTMGRTASSPDG